MTYSTADVLVNCERVPCVRLELTNISSQHVLNLLLLETTFDDESSSTVDGTSGTHFREHVGNDTFRWPTHAFTNVGYVGKDGLFVAISVDGRGGNGVPLSRCG